MYIFNDLSIVKHVHYYEIAIKSMNIKLYYIVVTLLEVRDNSTALNKVECRVVWHIHMCTHTCVHDWIAGQLYNYGSDKVPQTECQVAIRAYDQILHTNII